MEIASYVFGVIFAAASLLAGLTISAHRDFEPRSRELVISNSWGPIAEPSARIGAPAGRALAN